MADEITSEDRDDGDQPVDARPSRIWLDAIEVAERRFQDYQDKADAIDKRYADMEKLATDVRDRQFQLFWSNIQVLSPSIYARPPVPVVVPKFKDRRPLYRVASELLERCAVVSFDLADINSVMIGVRDDLTIVGRGVPWVRYETKAESKGYGERICYEWKDRKDFLHEPARKWAEVGWVAARSWLTRKEMRKRFRKSSGKAYQQATYEVRKEDRDNGAADDRKKCGVWEIWSKTDEKVVWVAEGVDVLLDDDKPHLTLEGFFPCPRPAYGTLQRRSLIPVPDYLYYKDQIEEINQLTNRLHSLADALKIRGFYPAGGSEIGDAVETAISLHDDRRVLIPVANWAAFGSGGDVIIWLPLKEIAETVRALVELRRQVIEDVYQIMGLSDIMRGTVDPEEKLGQSELKSQYGSVRIRDKQSELVRVARDMVRIGAEIMAENFDAKTLLDMSQMEIPTRADLKRKVSAVADRAQQEYDAKVKQALANPEVAQKAQENPQQAQQMEAQLREQIEGKARQEIAKLEEQPTIEDVMAFLRDQRLRPFVLDIETDSTIAPDEKAEKESRTEFVAALGGMLQQFGPVVAQVPQAAPLLGEVMKFALAPFRAGRELEGKIDEAVDQLAAFAQQPRPDPEAEKAKGEMAMKREEMQAKAKIEQQKIAAEQQGQAAEAAARKQENDAKLQQIQAQMERDREKHALEMQKLQMELQAKQADIAMKRETAQIDANAKAQQAEIATASAQQQANIAAETAERDAEHSEQAFRQKSALVDQQAAAKAAQGPTP